MKTDEHYTRNRHPGILCVDDEESCHILWKEELEEEGYIVHSAMSGEEALEIFDLAMHLGEPQIDIVILDINMPGMDGIEVLRQIKQKESNMPVILCSAYPEYKKNMASWECDDYIVKSFNLDDLKASVRKYLNFIYYTQLLVKDPYFSINMFNRENQFRRAILVIGNNILTRESGAPFVGIKYNIETRSAGIYFGGLDLDNLAEQTLVVQESRELYLLKQTEQLNPTRRLFVEGKEDADIACVTFSDDVPDEVKHKWTADIASRLCKKRGWVSQYDKRDWHKAKRLIEEATKPFIQ
jgi:CheY-like chemotaxis protein